MQPGATLRLGLCAVIEESDGRLFVLGTKSSGGQARLPSSQFFALAITCLVRICERV